MHILEWVLNFMKRRGSDRLSWDLWIILISFSLIDHFEPKWLFFVGPWTVVCEYYWCEEKKKEEIIYIPGCASK